MAKHNIKINVAVIGCGMRSSIVMSAFARQSGKKVNILSVFDPDMTVAKNYVDRLCPAAKVCSSYAEAMDMPGVQWVLIFSPNGKHREHRDAAFAREKHVFSEKPMATSIEDCVAIYENHKRHEELFFATGFVLRYSPVYRKAKELLDSGRFGKVLSISASENIHPELGSFIMRNWRRNRKLSGPYILEKCCHDLDLLMYFSGARPQYVSGFGCRNMFTAANAPLAKLYDFQKMTDPHATSTAFSDDGDIFDIQVANADMGNGVKVMFQSNMCNFLPERRMYICCTRGTLIIELYSGTIRYKAIDDPAEQIINYGAFSDGHGGGDDVIAGEIYRDVMCGGKKPACGGAEGLESAVFAIAVDEAMQKKQVVNLSGIWHRLGHETA